MPLGLISVMHTKNSQKPPCPKMRPKTHETPKKVKRDSLDTNLCMEDNKFWQLFFFFISRLGIVRDGSGHVDSHGLGGDHGHSHGSGNKLPGGSDDNSSHSHSQSNVEYDSQVKSRSMIPKDLNVRAAFIHVLGDLVENVGIFLAALMIYFKVNTCLNLSLLA